MGATGSGPGEEGHLGKPVSPPGEEEQQASLPGKREQWTSSSGKREQQVSSTGEREQQGGHLDEPGCQLTGIQSGLKGSGRAEKQTHQGAKFDRGPKPPQQLLGC